MALPHTSRSEPGLLWAGILALLVHVVFVVFMFFGLNWKTVPPESMVVDIWHDLPQMNQPPVKVESSKPKSIQQPVKKKQKPVLPSIKVSPPLKKPDIALKEKTKQPKPVKERKLEKVDQKKKQREKQKQKEKEKAEVLRQQREQAQQKQREQDALAKRAAQQAAARSRLMNEIAQYKGMILAKIKSRIVMPPDLPDNPAVEFSVTLLPGGDILDVRLLKSSGHATFDSAVERAVFLSKPLPLPPDPALFNEFRNLNITVHYEE